MFALAGCAPSLPGSWEESFSTDRNTMTIGSDGSGVARVVYATGVDEFELEWRESAEHEFELEMDCLTSTKMAGACDEEDFTMSCRLDGGSGDELACTGDAVWSDYPFGWEREPE